MDVRPVRDAGVPAMLALSLALLVQVLFTTVQAPVSTSFAALPRTPGAPVLEALSLGDTLPLAHALILGLQSFDDQPGTHAGFADLDYDGVRGWLAAVLDLDPLGQYPLLLAAHVYSQAPDPVRQRSMLDFVSSRFASDPARRWPWLAHASLVARHRLQDDRLALAFASTLATQPASVPMPGWARQMAVFLHEDLHELEAARVLLGGLLQSGVVQDAHEVRFLMHKLEALERADDSASLSTSRH
ncbi:MAG: hypothetical protein KIS79_10155 [Burkholderiales bacterium]|nr:hypothetical protein [Burkholderiales bacterium]